MDDRVFMFMSNPDPIGPYGDVHDVTGQKYGLYNLREGDIAESQDYSRHTTLDELRKLVEAAQSSVE